MTMALIDQERQKVLQNLHDVILWPDKKETRVRVECPLSCMGVDVDDEGCVTYADVHRLIALMERPTCFLDDDDVVERPFFYRTCTACGAYVDTRAVIDPFENEYAPTRYCPNCGAQVLIDDDD